MNVDIARGCALQPSGFLFVSRHVARAREAVPGSSAEVNAISTIETRINDRIRTPRVRLVGVEGDQLGIFVTSDAQKVADDLGLDLVEVAPNADPPVCRIMDYSKWKYEEAMKAKKARKNQTTIQVKEIKFRPKIDIHDYETKKKHVIRFIDAGAKVKVTIMFRGREMVHAERGLAILERLAEDIREIAHIENQPKLEGRNMFMLVSPSKKEIKPAARGESASKDKADEAAPEVATETTDGAATLADIAKVTKTVKVAKVAKAVVEVAEVVETLEAAEVAEASPEAAEAAE
jgi:translation initiation factor IF-3